MQKWKHWRFFLLLVRPDIEFSLIIVLRLKYFIKLADLASTFLQVSHVHLTSSVSTSIGTWCVKTENRILIIYFTILQPTVHLKRSSWLSCIKAVSKLPAVYIQGPISFSKRATASCLSISLRALSRSVTASGFRVFTSHKSKMYSVGLAFIVRKFV